MSFHFSEADLYPIFVRIYPVLLIIAGVALVCISSLGFYATYQENSWIFLLVRTLHTYSSLARDSDWIFNFVTVYHHFDCGFCFWNRNNVGDYFEEIWFRGKCRQKAAAYVRKYRWSAELLSVLAIITIRSEYFLSNHIW